MRCGGREKPVNASDPESDKRKRHKSISRAGRFLANENMQVGSRALFAAGTGMQNVRKTAIISTNDCWDLFVRTDGGPGNVANVEMLRT